MLSVLDEYSRFAMPPLVSRSIPAPTVVDHLRKLFRLYGIPNRIRSDNGPEFVAKTVTEWLTKLGVSTTFIKPASPWENAYVETWHDKLRKEKLNDEVLITLTEARVVIADWVDHYNHDRPHSRLGKCTPATVRYAGLTTPTLTQVDKSRGHVSQRMPHQTANRAPRRAALDEHSGLRLPATLHWLTSDFGDTS